MGEVEEGGEVFEDLVSQLVARAVVMGLGRVMMEGDVP